MVAGGAPFALNFGPKWPRPSTERQFPIDIRS